MSGILDLFIPREKKFFRIFEESSAKTYHGAKIFLQLINDYDKLSRAKRLAVVAELKQIEEACDELTHKVAIELNKTFITPLDREDIHKLSTLIDDIMDILYNASHKLILYNLKRIPRYMPELARVVFECSGEVESLIRKLGKKEAVSAHLRRIHQLEKESDSLRDEALAYLFTNSFSAIDVIKLKDLYEWLETICDKGEDIADVVEGIVIKYA